MKKVRQLAIPIVEDWRNYQDHIPGIEIGDNRILRLGATLVAWVQVPHAIKWPMQFLPPCIFSRQRSIRALHFSPFSMAFIDIISIELLLILSIDFY